MCVMNFFFDIQSHSATVPHFSRFTKRQAKNRSALPIGMKNIDSSTSYDVLY